MAYWTSLWCILRLFEIVNDVQVLIFVNEEYCMRMWFFSGTGSRYYTFLAVDNVSFMMSIDSVTSLLYSESQFARLSLIISPVILLHSKLPTENYHIRFIVKKGCAHHSMTDENKVKSYIASKCWSGGISNLKMYIRFGNVGIRFVLRISYCGEWIFESVSLTHFYMGSKQGNNDACDFSNSVDSIFWCCIVNGFIL